MRVLKNGPYIVSGNIPVIKTIIKCDSNGIPTEWIISKGPQVLGKIYSLCRCGQTKNKPFCDGTHSKVNFDGTETSGNEPFEKMANEIDGPELKLKDAVILCATARFCHRGGDIWPQIPKSDNPQLKQNAIRNSCDCPSGRLVVIDKKRGKVVEPSFEKSVGLVEDPGKGVDGPIWVRGEIPIYSTEGKLYEVRNRVTLCRCGKSANKPFCDSSHYPEEDQEVIKDEQR